MLQPRSPLPPHRALLTTHAALAHFADLFARAPLTPVRREWFCTPECLKEYRRLHMAWHIKRGRDPQFQLNIGKTMPEEEIEALLAGYAASLRAQQQFHADRRALQEAVEQGVVFKVPASSESREAADAPAGSARGAPIGGVNSVLTEAAPSE